MTARVLVAGVGNLFFGDDGFGVEVARALLAKPVPAGVRVIDVGIRGLHLAFELLEGWDRLIVIDAAARGEAPGTLYRIEPDDPGARAAAASAHGMDLDAVFAQVRAMGGTLPPVVVVGCEPGCLEEGLGLGEAVRAAVPAAVELVRELVGGEPAVAWDGEEAER